MMTAEPPPRLKRAWLITTVVGPMGLVLALGCWEVGLVTPSWFWQVLTVIFAVVGVLAGSLWLGISLGLFLTWLMEER